jgi:hypothetical protein
MKRQAPDPCAAANTHPVRPAAPLEQTGQALLTTFEVAAHALVPRVSGSETVRALERLGFAIVGQRGSHIIMRRGGVRLLGSRPSLTPAASMTPAASP